MLINLKKIIQIVPQLPPAINGLGDYALNLARQLYQDLNINTEFIIGDPTWSGNSKIEQFPVFSVASQSTTALLSLLNNHHSLILLHYVGYGYAKRGCPWWLIEALEAHQHIKKPKQLLITMFHEVYASGQPWTSAFWLSPFQKNLATRLVKISSHCLTSSQVLADIIKGLEPHKKTSITTLPIFSNIGEPKDLPPLSSRSRRLVIFGTPGVRLRAYQNCLDGLTNICQALRIQEIYDIGQPIHLKISQINGIPVTKTGVIQSDQISQIFLDSIAGFLDYPPYLLAKSTIFAAYCAHHLIPILNPTVAIPSQDGLKSNEHYWQVDDHQMQLNWELGQTIASQAHCWYQTHSLSIQAGIFAQYAQQNLC